jgi:hypothetical protein
MWAKLITFNVDIYYKIKLDDKKLDKIITAKSLNMASVLAFEYIIKHEKVETQYKINFVLLLYNKRHDSIEYYYYFGSRYRAAKSTYKLDLKKKKRKTKYKNYVCRVYN